MNEITPNPAPAEGTPEAVKTPESTPAPESGTEPKETGKTEQPTTPQDVETVDYREKFIESAKGAHALLEEKKRLEARIAELEDNPSAGTPSDLPTHSPDTEILYPGFENLDEEAQANLKAYTDAVMNKTRESIYKDPAIAFAQKTYNDTKWNGAFANIAAKYPELESAKEDFKTKYYNPQNVPDNIEEILETVAKSYLFDKARDIGAQEGQEVAQRVQLEEPTGGDKTPSVHRSLADWQRMAQQNPAKFAQLRKEYEADLASGKLKE